MLYFHHKCTYKAPPDVLAGFRGHGRVSKEVTGEEEGEQRTEGEESGGKRRERKEETIHPTAIPGSATRRGTNLML